MKRTTGLLLEPHHAAIFILFAMAYLTLNGCSNSASNPDSSLPTMVVPKAGSSFTYRQITVQSGIVLQRDTATVIDSVIESGVSLGSHTNVLHVLRKTFDGRTPDQDMFINFENNGDLALQNGSLAFPDQATWMILPFRSLQTWSALVLDSTITISGGTVRLVVNDTNSFAGYGKTKVGAVDLNTIAIQMSAGEDQITTDSVSGIMQTFHVQLLRTLAFAPEIGYFAEDHEVDIYSVGSELGSQTDRVLQQYTLK